jgi:dolichol-phosphate mannosyltransferase
MNDAIVIIPTYNERDNLEAIVRRTLTATSAVDVLIVDDNSPDGTGGLADELSDTNPRIRVLHRAAKEGLGVAYKDAFRWAARHHYTQVVEMDADGSHHPEALPAMLALLEDHDLVLGSRWIPGGSVQNWSKGREALSRGGNLYTRLALGIRVHDATGGFRAFRVDALHRLDLDDVASHGYCFQVDVVWRALQRSLSVVEYPITFTERVHGYSKMSRGIVAESLTQVTLWGVQRRLSEFAAVLLHGKPLPSVRRTSSVTQPG